MKTIIGVAHSDAAEIDEVKQILSAFLFETVGIELPQNYLMNASHGIGTFFFGDIASQLANEGKRIVPLEDTCLLSRYKAVELALAITEGQANKEQVERELALLVKKAQNPFGAPEETYPALCIAERCSTALEILGDAKTEEGVRKILEQSVRDRTSWSLEKIRRDGPEVVIAGDGHAQMLAKRLPEYAYMATTAAKNLSLKVLC